MPNSKGNSIQWSELNERQQNTLQVIFECDQAAEKENASRWNRGLKPRPASVWRWIIYGHKTNFEVNLHPLKLGMRDKELVDQGTGSTFEALRKRGLIEVRYDQPEEGWIDVKLTPAGRKLVREGTGNPAPKKLPTGTLREWHWRALALAVEAGDEGLAYDGIGNYGGIKWQSTWLRLRDYYELDVGLIEEFQPTHKDYRLRVSAAGRKYYRENWQKYRQLYPDVQAVEPLPASEEESDVRKPLPEPFAQRDWQALALAVSAGAEGLSHNDAVRYVNFLVWVKLKNYGLIERFQPNQGAYRLRATATGREYYCENWQKYRKMYPEVEAVEPSSVTITQSEKQL